METSKQEVRDSGQSPHTECFLTPVWRLKVATLNEEHKAIYVRNHYGNRREIQKRITNVTSTVVNIPSFADSDISGIPITLY